MRGSAAIHWFGGQNYELSDRCFCCLRVASRPCLHRSGTLFAEGLDRRSSSPEGHIRAGRRQLFDQASACSRDDRARPRGWRAVPLGCGRYAREGVELDRTTMAAWVGKVAALRGNARERIAHASLPSSRPQQSQHIAGRTGNIGLTFIGGRVVPRQPTWCGTSDPAVPTSRRLELRLFRRLRWGVRPRSVRWNSPAHSPSRRRDRAWTPAIAVRSRADRRPAA